MREPRTICSIGGSAFTSWRRRRRRDEEETLSIGDGPNQSNVRVIQKSSHPSSLHPAVRPRLNELGQRQQTGGVDEQRGMAVGGHTRGARRRPVCPIAADRKCTHLNMTQAQPLSARDHPDLQYNEALAAKRMKGMGYLGRSQSLTGPKCSSKQPCQRSLTESRRRWSKPIWSRNWRNTSIRIHMVIDQENRHCRRWELRESVAGDTPGRSIWTSAPVLTRFRTIYY